MEQKQSGYLYGITALLDGVVECNGIGNPAQKVQLLPVGGVGVILSYLGPDFGEVSIEDAVQHMRVLEWVMERASVLPIRFGTVSESLTDLKRMIISNVFPIKKELHRLAEKYEVGVKAYWRKDRIVSELQREKDYAELVEQAKHDGQAGIELGQRVEAIVNEWRDQMEPQIHRELSGLTTESVLGEPMSVEMIYNGSFLVTPGQDAKLNERLLELADKKLQGRFEFHYTTKLPPYNFVKLNLHWGNHK